MARYVWLCMYVCMYVCMYDCLCMAMYVYTKADLSTRFFMMPKLNRIFYILGISYLNFFCSNKV